MSGAEQWYKCKIAALEKQRDAYKKERDKHYYEALTLGRRNAALSATVSRLNSQFVERIDRLKDRNDALADALNYARRFLRPEDHDVDYVDKALAANGGATVKESLTVQDEAGLAKFIEEGTKAWADVPDAAAWQRNLRGAKEPERTCENCAHQGERPNGRIVRACDCCMRMHEDNWTHKAPVKSCDTLMDGGGCLPTPVIDGGSRSGEIVVLKSKTDSPRRGNNYVDTRRMG